MAVTELLSDSTLLTSLSSSRESMAHALEMLSWVDANQSQEPSLEARYTLSRFQKTMIASLAELRAHNRQVIFSVRATKQETAEARQEVDRLLLQLQNLYYEQRHLMGEIRACEEYDHTYTHLPLLPLASYLEAFPEQSNLPEVDLMPLRIEHEKQEREKLEQQRRELLKTKENLAKANLKKKDELKKIDEQFEKIIEGLRPTTEALAKDI